MDGIQRVVTIFPVGCLKFLAKLTLSCLQHLRLAVLCKGQMFGDEMVSGSTYYKIEVCDFGESF